ncbi:hypothetical protein BDC45DRAFT_94871 [Circinella umbellata]|nr:hypothetical protein BDC45DRAFT_94871 [Circinella umbellata]
MPWFEHYFIYDQVLFLLLLLFVALVVFAVIFIFPVPLHYHFYLYQDVVFQDVLLTIPTIPIFFLSFFFWFFYPWHPTNVPQQHPVGQEVCKKAVSRNGTLDTSCP